MSDNTQNRVAPAGWYDDGSGNQRWWDGTQWSAQFTASPTRAPWSALGLAGFIVSLVACSLVTVQAAGIVAALVGGILSGVGMTERGRRGRGFAIAGVVLSVLAALACIAYSFAERSAA